MHIDTFGFWMGNQTSYNTYEGALSAVQQAILSGNAAFVGSPKAEKLPPLLSVVGDVGVIQVRGSMIDGSAGYGLYFGVVGYEDIKLAAHTALSNDSIKSIVFDMATNGGSAAGCEDCAQFLADVGRIKPTVTYTSGPMMSAGLWTGLAANKVVVASTAIVGSLGVLRVLSSQSKALEAAGIEAKVIRAGEHKALGHPAEPISEEAVAAYTAQAEKLYDIFAGSVQRFRGMNDAQILAAGRGREFVGADAVKMKLADQVGTFEDAIALARSMVDSKPGQRHNPLKKGNTSMKTVFSDAQLAALVAAGVELTAEQKSALEAHAKAEADKAAAEAAIKAAADAATLAAKGSDGIALVLGQLTAATTQVGALTAEVASLKAAAESGAAHLPKLLGFLQKSITTMAVALGEKVEAEKLGAAETLAQVERLTPLYQAKFKVGGIAAPVSEETKPGASTADVPEWFHSAVETFTKK